MQVDDDEAARFAADMLLHGGGGTTPPRSPLPPPAYPAAAVQPGGAPLGPAGAGATHGMAAPPQAGPQYLGLGSLPPLHLAHAQGGAQPGWAAQLQPQGLGAQPLGAVPYGAQGMGAGPQLPNAAQGQAPLHYAPGLPAWPPGAMGLLGPQGHLHAQQAQHVPPPPLPPLPPQPQDAGEASSHGTPLAGSLGDLLWAAGGAGLGLGGPGSQHGSLGDLLWAGAGHGHPSELSLQSLQSLGAPSPLAVPGSGGLSPLHVPAEAGAGAQGGQGPGQAGEGEGEGEGGGAVC